MGGAVQCGHPWHGRASPALILTSLDETGDTKLRIDKWLWAARFFKTRALAADAVEGGKVHLNEARVKPSKTIHLGDTLQIRIGHVEYTVLVQGLSGKRGPASEAAKLYAETEASRSAREALSQQKKMEQVAGAERKGRPTKRDRRLIQRFIE
jgi:ribosome-associated heat shock protein Hsp15